jgi:hypothetical protein
VVLGGGQNAGPIVRTPQAGGVRAGGVTRGSGATGGLVTQQGPSLRRGGAVSYGGTRSGVVAGPGGAVAATRRQGVVSYSHGHHGHHHHGHHHHHGYHDHHHHGYYHPWWFHSGPAYGFGFGVSWYDPWPWYGAWGFGGYGGYGGYASYPSVAVYPQPVYVVPSPDVYVEPGVVLPADPALGAPPAGAVPAVPAPDAGLVPQGPVPAAPPAPDAGTAPAPDAGTAPGTSPEATRKGLEEAFEHFRGGRYAEAFARLDVVVQADPTNGEAWMGRFFAAFPIGRYADGAASLARAAELGAFPRGYRYDPKPLFDASAQAANGGTPSPSFDGHFARLSAHLNANPADADAYAVLAYLHVAMGRTAEAEAALASLAAIRPADPLLPHLRTALLPPEKPATTPATPNQPPR